MILMGEMGGVAGTGMLPLRLVEEGETWTTHCHLSPRLQRFGFPERSQEERQ